MSIQNLLNPSIQPWENIYVNKVNDKPIPSSGVVTFQAPAPVVGELATYADTSGGVIKNSSGTNISSGNLTVLGDLRKGTGLNQYLFPANNSFGYLKNDSSGNCSWENSDYTKSLYYTPTFADFVNCTAPVSPQNPSIYVITNKTVVIYFNGVLTPTISLTIQFSITLPVNPLFNMTSSIYGINSSGTANYCVAVSTTINSNKCFLTFTKSDGSNFQVSNINFTGVISYTSV